MIRYYWQAHYSPGGPVFKNSGMAKPPGTSRLRQAQLGRRRFARFLVACHVGCEQYDLAVRELEKCSSTIRKTSPCVCALALARYKQGSQLEARATLREGLVRQPEQAELHYQLGVLLAADEDWVDAERSLEMRSLTSPPTPGPMNGLAQLCAVRGRYERAVQYLEAAHGLDPLNARIAFQLACWHSPRWQAALAGGGLANAGVHCPVG